MTSGSGSPSYLPFISTNCLPRSTSPKSKGQGRELDLNHSVLNYSSGLYANNKRAGRETGNICWNSTRNPQVWKSPSYDSTGEIEMHAHRFCCLVVALLSRFKWWVSGHARKPAETIILQHKCTSMIGLQIVNLFLENLRPKVLAYELDCFQMITKTRPLHGVPFGELMADLVADGLDPASGEIGLVGVEAIAVGRHHFGQ